MGRNSKLPLSLVYKPHVCDYRTEYKNKWEKVNRFLKKRWKNINCVKILTKQSFWGKRQMGKVLTVWGKYCILNKSVITEQAAVAQ